MVPKTRPPYPPEVRREAVRLARSSGRPISEASRELGVSAESLRKWVNQTEIDAGERDGRASDEREELARLGRENRILMQEAILRKAAAFFAREDGIRRTSPTASTTWAELSSRKPKSSETAGRATRRWCIC